LFFFLDYLVPLVVQCTVGAHLFFSPSPFSFFPLLVLAPLNRLRGAFNVSWPPCYGLMGAWNRRTPPTVLAGFHSTSPHLLGPTPSLRYTRSFHHKVFHFQYTAPPLRDFLPFLVRDGCVQRLSVAVPFNVAFPTVFFSSFWSVDNGPLDGRRLRVKGWAS